MIVSIAVTIVVVGGVMADSRPLGLVMTPVAADCEF